MSWDVAPDGQTAIGPTLPVIVEGTLVAVVQPLWDDDGGERVWLHDDGQLDDLSAAQWHALRDAVDAVFALEPPHGNATSPVD